MEKYNNISMLRIFATLIIFIFHCLYFTLGIFISEKIFPLYFGVNIFLFLSAFLYANKPIKNIKHFFAKQYVKLLTPALLILAIFFLLELVINVDIFHHVEGYFAITNMWYVPVILVCYSIIPMLNAIMPNKEDKPTSKKFKILSWITIIGLCVGEFVLDIFLYFQVVIFCFVLSYLLAKKLKGDFSKKGIGLISWGIFLLLTVIFIIIGFFEGQIPSPENPIINASFTVGQFIKHYIVAGMGISFSIGFIETFKFINKNNKLKPIFQITDRYSYSFYLVQQILLTGMFAMIHLTPFMYINFIIITCSVCVLAFIIESIAELISNPILSKCNTTQQVKTISFDDTITKKH